MTNLSDLLPAGAASKQLSFTASGAISNGQTVGLNSDGTVSVIGEAIGAVTTFTSNRQTYTSAVYDPTNNRVVVFYRDQGDSDKGKAQVGTVSGTSISFGSAVEFEAGQTNYIDAVFDPDDNYVLVSYEDDTNSSYGTAIVGAVSGTSISFGTAVVFSSTNVRETSITYDTNVDRVAIAFSSYTSYESGFGVAGQVSGTSITFGTAVRFDTDNTSTAVQNNNMVFDSSNNKVVNIYKGTSNKIQGVVATISGTTISFGTPVDVSSGTSYRQPNAVFDANAGKIVSVFRSGGDGDKVVGVVGTVSGTSISFGSVSVLGSIAAPNDGIGLAYSPDSQNSLVTYRQNDSPKSVYQLVATVSGTSVSSSGERVAYSGSQGAEVKNGSLVYDTSSNQFVSCVRENNTDYGLSFVHLAGSSVSSTSFLGIADAAISNAASGKITMKGGVATNSQLLPLTYTGTLGSEAVFQTADTTYTASCYDPDSGKTIIAWEGTSDYGYAVVATVGSDNSITYGTPVAFNSVTTKYIAISYDTGQDKVLIVYQDDSAPDEGKAIVGTVSGTSISFGSAVTIYGSNDGGFFGTLAYSPDTANHITTYNTGGSTSKVTVLTVSGTSVSVGGTTNLTSGTVYQQSVTYDTTANKFVVSYRDSGNSSYGTAVVVTVSGTTPSLGTATVFSSRTTFQNEIVYDSSNDKVVIHYRGSSPQNPTAIVGTVSGTSISFGSATEIAVLNDGDSQAIGFDSSAGRIIVAYRDEDPVPENGKYAIGKVSGTSISFDTPVTFNAASTKDIAISFNAGVNRNVITYRDEGNSNYGTAIVLQLTGAYPNLVPNSTYYVQDDGTLSTTSSSVTAGKAMSTNSINLDYST